MKKLYPALLMLLSIHSPLIQSASLQTVGNDNLSNNFQNQYGTPYYSAPFYGAPLNIQQQQAIAEQQRAFKIHRQTYWNTLRDFEHKRQLHAQKRATFLSPKNIRQRHQQLQAASQARHAKLMEKITSHRKLVKKQISDAFKRSSNALIHR